jgi:hypothetical protein
MSWSALTHSGTVTACSRQTGDHRTFRVTGIRGDDESFMPGKRLVELLEGPDNTWDYRAFGYVGEKRIVLWRKHRHTALYEWAARFLVDPEAYESQVTLYIAAKCRRCGRELTTPHSLNRGIGPECARILGAE